MAPFAVLAGIAYASCESSQEEPVTTSAIDSPLSPELARQWLERWDRQQEGYIPQREGRFRAIVELVREVCGDAPLVLDLACGPGSLTQRILEAIPGASVVAVDLDPLLLAIAKAALGDAEGRVTWVEASLAEPSWLEALGGRQVDAAVSTTALHWLDADVLMGLYRQLGAVVREGGVFLNGDHMDYPASERGIAAAVRAIRDRRTEEAFAAPEMEDYQAWHDEFRALPELASLIAERDRRFESRGAERWRAGYEMHRAGLLNAGFREVTTVWQDLDNRVIAALR